MHPWQPLSRGSSKSQESLKLDHSSREDRCRRSTGYWCIFKQPFEEIRVHRKKSACLVEDVWERLGTSYRLDSLASAYDERGMQLHVRVAGKTPPPEELATVVRTVASDHDDQLVRVRLETKIGIHVDANK